MFLFLSFSSPAPSHDTHSADPVKIEVAMGKCPCNVSVVLGCICAPLILNSLAWLTHSSQGWVLQLHSLSQSKLAQSKWSEKYPRKMTNFFITYMYRCTNLHRRQSLITKWRNVDQWRNNYAKHLLLTGCMNSTHSARPTKLIVTPHLQFTQLQLVEVFQETRRPLVNKGVWCLFQPHVTPAYRLFTSNMAGWHTIIKVAI